MNVYIAEWECDELDSYNYERIGVYATEAAAIEAAETDYRFPKGRVFQELVGGGTKVIPFARHEEIRIVRVPVQE